MPRSLTDEDIDAISHRLTEFSGLTPEEHRDHHEAFASFVAMQKRKTEFWEKVRQQVGGWMIISVLSGIGISGWKLFVWAAGVWVASKGGA